MRPAKAQARLLGSRLRIHAEHSLLTDMKQIDQTTKVIRHLAPLDEQACVFENVPTEDKKYMKTMPGRIVLCVHVVAMTD